MEKTEYAKLFKTASTVCRKAGYPVTDSEYQSAINFAIGKAISNHSKSSGRDLSSWCCLLAIHECRDTSRTLADWVKQDRVGAGRGRCESPVSTPIKLFSFEILSFCARHGRTRAARMLNMTVPKINELLTDITREMDAVRCG